MCKAVQHATILTAIPLEEHLIGTEDARHAIDRHATMLQDMQVIIPELILDKESHHRSHRAQETTRIGDGVQRQIANNVGTLIILAHFIARRREERQQNLILRMLTAQLLHQRASLFKLTQRSSMEPHILCFRINLLSQDAECLTLTTPHFPHLFVEATVNSHSKKIQIYD